MEPIWSTIMPTLTIKNIPNNVYRLLKQRAALHRRSINSEVIVCLEDTLESRRLDPEEILIRARMLRERTSGQQLTDSRLLKFKRQGRP